MDFQCVFWNGRTEKHQTSTAVFLAGWKNWVTQPLPRSLCAVSTSTPKPRAEGSSPSAPAKNREASTMLASLFFVSAHKDSATRHGCAPRSACRGASACQWHSAAPVSAPASVGAGRSPPGSSTRGSRRDQVLLPLPFEIWLDSWISRFQAIFFTL